MNVRDGSIIFHTPGVLKNYFIRNAPF